MKKIYVVSVFLVLGLALATLAGEKLGTIEKREVRHAQAAAEKAAKANPDYIAYTNASAVIAAIQYKGADANVQKVVDDLKLALTKILSGEKVNEEAKEKPTATSLGAKAITP
ncbi:MAG: hypothetical protein HQ559_15655 [Lentisphaerae bacterium]|nr:hypothetical protein [Lentisphaerota bacterium]